jgi:hypothetical protein
MHAKEIKIYYHPNTQIRSFLTQTEISSYRVEQFRNPLDKESEEKLKALGLLGAQMVKEIMEIPDVEKLIIKPKEIRIKKRRLSTWESIEDRVMDILSRALARKRFQLVKG